MKVFLYSTY